jgi:hypothetical protein
MWEESGLQFSFSPAWEVIRWDRHTYYQGLSSSGLKGVDFIAYRRKGGVFLMEVKNYRGQKPPPPSGLAREFLRKGQDTVRGLAAVLNFLQRHPVRNTLIPLWSHIPPRWSERALWTQVSLAFACADKIPYLLWVEGDQIEPDWWYAFQSNLPGAGSRFQFHLACSTSNPLSEIVEQVQ